MPSHEEVLEIDRHEVNITRPDKVLFRDDKITKHDLVDYYRRVSSWILPDLADRPLMLERYPDGIDEMRIVQKSAASYYPRWVHVMACFFSAQGGYCTLRVGFSRH